MPTTANLVLEAIVIGLTLVDRASRDRITNKIYDLRTKYAEELARPIRPVEPNEEVTEANRPIDGALVYSLERELRDIVQLYRTAVQQAAVPSQPQSSG